VEKVHQRRSRAFVELRAHILGALRAVRPHVLLYAPGAKAPAALLDGLFEQSLPLLFFLGMSQVQTVNEK